MFKLFAPDHHDDPNPWKRAPAWAVELGAMMIFTLERMDDMATQAQIDKLQADVAALIDAGVAEITAAVAAAQKASPDPAIDALDGRVVAATQTLKDASTALTTPAA